MHQYSVLIVDWDEKSFRIEITRLRRTLGAISEACEDHMRNSHVVAHANRFMTKLTKPPLTYKRGLCLSMVALLALFPWLT
jgi:hypothetical protein